jgi:hypothetical protein
MRRAFFVLAVVDIVYRTVVRRYVRNALGL